MYVLAEIIGQFYFEPLVNSYVSCIVNSRTDYNLRIATTEIITV